MSESIKCDKMMRNGQDPCPHCEMDREKIQNIIDQVKDLFTYGKKVNSPTIAKLNEKLWKEFADKNGYNYTDPL